MNRKELITIIDSLEKEKLMIEYKLQNYRERLCRLIDYNRESEEIVQNHNIKSFKNDDEMGK